jgi:hypothetical protein
MKARKPVPSTSKSGEQTSSAPTRVLAIKKSLSSKRTKRALAQKSTTSYPSTFDELLVAVNRDREGADQVFDDFLARHPEVSEAEMDAYFRKYGWFNLSSENGWKDLCSVQTGEEGDDDDDDDENDDDEDG